jgi:hypothetical protein
MHIVNQQANNALHKRLEDLKTLRLHKSKNGSETSELRIGERAWAHASKGGDIHVLTNIGWQLAFWMYQVLDVAFRLTMTTMLFRRLSSTSTASADEQFSTGPATMGSTKITLGHALVWYVV